MEELRESLLTFSIFLDEYAVQHLRVVGLSNTYYEDTHGSEGKIFEATPTEVMTDGTGGHQIDLSTLRRIDDSNLETAVYIHIYNYTELTLYPFIER